MLNNKGFTLVEVLAVVVILSIVGVVAVPNVLQTITHSKDSGEKLMIDNIKTSAQELYEEVEFNGVNISGGKRSSLKNYDGNGTDKGYVTISGNQMTVYLQTLVMNGFISGTGDEDDQKLIHPKTNKNIGNCQIKVTKSVSGDFDITYTISKVGTDANCPNY